MFFISEISRKAILFISFLCLGCLWLLPEAKESLPPLQPYKTATPPVIDGILDDPVWQNAPQVTGFKTWHPDYEKDMRENTIVYSAYDRENLYFAFQCFDREPDRIKSSVTSRDNVRDDDWIGINLDSFNDQQSLYAFYCNPIGIQGDSRFEGGTEDHTVDIVWYSAGRIDDKGYTVEFKIPFKSIRFSHKEPVEMGVIFERAIIRHAEVGTCPPLDPVQGSNFLTQMRSVVLYEIKHYTLFEMLPAVTYSNRSEVEKGKLDSLGSESDISLTAKYGITSHLIFDGTYNPDFSQVEADAGQVDFNLRYALFFPETRPFFLEGLEKLNFGGYDPGDPLGEIVHTRTIVDPLTGVKLNGKIGDNDTIALIYALDELPDEEADDYAHFGILRYKRSLAKDGFIGGFYTSRERKTGFNRVFGLDGQFRLTSSSLLGYHLFKSQGRISEQAPKDSGHALSLHYYYSTRDWILMLGLQDIAPDFRTEIGYITRTGITRFRSGFLRKLYPKSKIIKRIDPMIHSFHIQDKFSNLYETSNSLDLRLLLLKNSFFIIGYRYSNEVFVVNRFNTSRLRGIISSQLTKKLYLSLSYEYKKKIRYLADPYPGRGSDVHALVNYLPSEKLHLDLSLTYSDFTRDSDSIKEYDYIIIRSRNTYQLNRYLFFRGIIEYNSFRKRLMTDFLASFTYIPGTVIHMGYGSLYERIKWEENVYRSSDRFLETKRGFFFKASILWRL